MSTMLVPETPGQLDALRLAAGQGPRRPLEGQVPRPTSDQGTEDVGVSSCEDRLGDAWPAPAGSARARPPIGALSAMGHDK